MADRIDDLWGGRTPYAPGERWPVRVDQHLGDGISPDEVQRWVRSASVLHSNGDALDIAVVDDRIVGVEIPTGNPLEIELDADLKPTAVRYLDQSRAEALPPLQ